MVPFRLEDVVPWVMRLSPPWRVNVCPMESALKEGRGRRASTPSFNIVRCLLPIVNADHWPYMKCPVLLAAVPTSLRRSNSLLFWKAPYSLETICVFSLEGSERPCPCPLHTTLPQLPQYVPSSREDPRPRDWKSSPSSTGIVMASQLTEERMNTRYGQILSHNSYPGASCLFSVVELILENASEVKRKPFPSPIQKMCNKSPHFPGTIQVIELFPYDSPGG